MLPFSINITKIKNKVPYTGGLVLKTKFRRKVTEIGNLILENANFVNKKYLNAKLYNFVNLSLVKLK